jgi:signal transduction histidine kinase
MIEIILTVITFLFNTFLGIMVFVHNPKSWTGRFFLILALLINSYLITNYISLHPPQSTTDVQLFWIRIVMFVTSFIGPILFILVHTFPDAKIKLKRKFILALVMLCLTSAIASLTPLVFSSLQFPGGKPVPTPGPAIPVFFFDFVGLFILSFVLLIIKYRNSTGVIRIQLLYFLLGIILTFSIMAISTVVSVVLLKQSDFVFIGPISTIFLIVCVAYSIVRHRFLDIRLLVARSVAYFLLVIILRLFYATDMFLISNYFFQEHVKESQAFVYALLALFIAFTFQPLKSFLEDVTDGIFFKGKYDSNELIFDLTKIMATTLSLGQLTQQTLSKLLNTLRISRGAFILFREKEDFIILQIGHNDKPSFDSKLVSRLAKLRRILIYDEEEDKEVRELMRELDIAVALPLFEKEHEDGLLVLGEKGSGEPYSGQDINLLRIFGPEVSVAIRNSKSYEEIRRFNITLHEEVDRATKELQDKNDQLKQLDKLKDDFVSVASHELRTPMTAIKSYLWMALAGQGGPLNDKQKYYVQRSYSSVERLIKLVNDMLNISRIESGRLTVEMSSLNIVKLVKEVVEEVGPGAKELGVSVELEVGDDVPMVMADADKIKEVVYNLIGNSMKFTQSGGKIMVSISKKDKMVEVMVKDTGAGIAPEDLPKLFQKFGILPGSYVTNQPALGTGLGLYICRSLVELHGGRIRAASEGREKGATFTFSLKEFNEEEMREVNKKYKQSDRKAELISSKIL